MTELQTEIVQLARLESTLATDRERYASAAPFSHVVLDGLLDQGAFERACSGFPPIDEASWKSYLHINERKYANQKPDTWDAALREIHRELSSDRFVAYLEQLTGFSGLLADPEMDGGGLHQSFRGGYLNLHADFTSHHTHLDWRRRVNILVYLNREWDADWGGQLEFWDQDRSRCVERVAPIGNRLVVFTTDETSYHGHPDPMTCPNHVGRQSLALYYFQRESDPLTQATDYRARPDDGINAVSIYLDKKMLSVYDVVKRRLNLRDDFASNLLSGVNRLRTAFVERTRGRS
jgi:hypothetical protein